MGEGFGDGFADGEEAAFEALDEEGEADDHAHEANEHIGEIREGLLEHDGLEEGDHEDDGGEVAQGVPEPLADGEGDGHCGIQVRYA